MKSLIHFCNSFTYNCHKSDRVIIKNSGSELQSLHFKDESSAENEIPLHIQGLFLDHYSMKTLIRSLIQNGFKKLKIYFQPLSYQKIEEIVKELNKLRTNIESKINIENILNNYLIINAPSIR